MDSTKRRFAKALAGAAAVATVPRWAGAQGSWPSRPVRLVIPFGVGGGSDVAARMFAQELAARWGQQVIVDNRPGADTVIAASEVQRAAPDGHTLLMTINSTLTLTPHTMAKVPYDPLADFTYIGQLTDVPLVLMVGEGVPAKTFGELVELAKTKPGQLNAGGAAALTQLMTEQVGQATGTKMTWVMYKSGAEITRALLGGEVQVGADAIAQNLPHIQSGKIRVLAVNTAARTATLPDVPTFQELGVRAPLVSLQHYLLAPRGLPPAIVSKIQADAQAMLGAPAVRDKLLSFGFQAGWLEGVQAQKNVAAQYATTGELVKALGMKPQ